MIVMSFSGGAIFLLPFLQEVYYIPVSEALGLNNTEVGGLLSETLVPRVVPEVRLWAALGSGYDAPVDERLVALLRQLDSDAPAVEAGPAAQARDEFTDIDTEGACAARSIWLTR